MAESAFVWFLVIASYHYGLSLLVYPEPYATKAACLEAGEQSVGQSGATFMCVPAEEEKP